MDDNSSVLSSCYWDAMSVTSDSTIPTEMFHTPTGSLLDIHATDEMCTCDESSNSLTPVFQEMRISNHSIDEPQIDPTDGVVVTGEEDTDDNKRESVVEPVVPLLRPPLIRQEQEVRSSVTDKIQESPKRKNWKQNLARRLTSTRSRIMRSFSIEKYKEENGQYSKNIFQSMRHSIRRIRSHDKRTNKEPRSDWSKDTQKHSSESTSAIIGSDCDYFNFVKEQNVEITSKNEHLSFNSDNNEDTPLKPRRQFTQEKYITGSKDTMQKAYNSLKRKSYMPSDKSLFDICSTVSNLFTCDPHLLLPLDGETKFHKFMERCVNAFLEVHIKQIENSLHVINKAIGEHIDLNTPNLDVINKSKKYQVTEIFGSKGICIITNTTNKDQFIALKTSSPTNWIRLTSFLQHIEENIGPAPNQEWICFPAQSVTTVHIEKFFFNVRHVECQLILETLVQLILLLYNRMDPSHIKIDPSNILLISSNLSLIVVFTELDEDSSTDEKKSYSILSFSSDKERRRAYQESVMKLNKYVDKFLSSPENSSHFITASYPLDFLFYLLIKLHKDINNLIKCL